MLGVAVLLDAFLVRHVLPPLAAVDKARSRAGYALVAVGPQRCLTETGGGLDGVEVGRTEKRWLALA